MCDTSSAGTGAAGERIAALFYRLKGYRILDTNFRTRQGELDIVAQKRETLVFIEVKTRGENAIAEPAEFVTSKKQRRLILAARRYIMLNPQLSECMMRFDVVEVFMRRGGIPCIHCIEDAFTL